MVKVTFNSALAQKEVKKDSETLIPDDKVTFLFFSQKTNIFLIKAQTETQVT